MRSRLILVPSMPERLTASQSIAPCQFSSSPLAFSNTTRMSPWPMITWFALVGIGLVGNRGAPRSSFRSVDFPAEKWPLKARRNDCFVSIACQFCFSFSVHSTVVVPVIPLTSVFLSIFSIVFANLAHPSVHASTMLFFMRFFPSLHMSNRGHVGHFGACALQW